MLPKKRLQWNHEELHSGCQRSLPGQGANVLQKMFGHFGYPRILHTDNGREFTGQVLLEELHKRCPGLLTVTGQPRMPRDQGSIKNMNQQVMKAIHLWEQNHRLDGKWPNWTLILGSVKLKLNAKEKKENMVCLCLRLFSGSSIVTMMGLSHSKK